MSSVGVGVVGAGPWGLNVARAFATARGATLRARELIAAGELGPLRYLQATRVAFGTVRANESAWWSVAPHDVAVALYLFDAVPTTVSATGAAYLRPGLADVAFATLRFGDG